MAHGPTMGISSNSVWRSTTHGLEWIKFLCHYPLCGTPDQIPFSEPSLCSYAFNFSWEPDSCHGGCPGCSLLYTERICDECHFTRFPLGAVHSDYHHVERMDFLTLNWLGSRIRANSSTWLNTSADWKENRPKSSLQFFLSCHVKIFGMLLDSFLIGL